MTNINETLAERQKTHGEFKSHAEISQKLKMVLRERGGGLSDMQREGLDMILHKVARILNGNPNHKDHWDDISGYATLVSRSLEEKK